jgi:hypothetical protein
MANTLIPIEERNLNPEEVVALDRRRRRGQLFLVLCFQCLIVGALVTLWAGQDLTYSPGWARPIRRRRRPPPSRLQRVPQLLNTPAPTIERRHSDSKSQNLRICFSPASGIIPV